MIAVLALAAAAAWPTGGDRLQIGSQWSCVAPAKSGVRDITFRVSSEKNKVLLQFDPDKGVRPDIMPATYGEAEHPMAYTDKSLNLFGAAKEWSQQFFFPRGYASFFWNSKDQTIDLEITGGMSGRDSDSNFQVYTCERNA